MEPCETSIIVCTHELTLSQVLFFGVDLKGNLLLVLD